MNIEPIENNEQGLSVREKLNKMISAVRLECLLTATTTDNTQTELLMEDESDPRLTIPLDTAWAFEILLLSWTGGGGAAAAVAGAWKITGAIYNNDGTVKITDNWDATNPSYSTAGKFDPAKAKAPTVTVTVLAGDESNTFGDPQVDADTGHDSLRIRVTATNYSAAEFHWAARVSLVEVQFTP
jgi:hypothetical protein